MRALNSLSCSVFAALCFSASPSYAGAPLNPDTVTSEDEAYLVAEFDYIAAKFSYEPPTVHLRLLRNDTPENIVTVRRACALNSMPHIYEAVARDRAQVEASGAKAAPMPELTTFCLTALDEARKRNILPGLYANLALQEQGVHAQRSAKQAPLLQNNEAWHTTEAILKAANAGQVAYTSISGQLRVLPCPLALDAGYTWATGNLKAEIPVALTQAEVAAAARQCYDPTITTTITLHGTAYPVQQAGVIVGAWLARNGG